MTGPDIGPPRVATSVPVPDRSPAELARLIDDWRATAPGVLDLALPVIARHLRVLDAVPQYERDLAAGLLFTAVPDGWTLTRHVDDSDGYGDCPADDSALLAPLSGASGYLLSPHRRDPDAPLEVTVQRWPKRWSYPSWDAAVADLTTPFADRVAAIQEGMVAQLEGDWYLRPPGTPRAVPIGQTMWRPMRIEMDGNGAPSLLEGHEPAVFRYAADGVVWTGRLAHGMWTPVDVPAPRP